MPISDKHRLLFVHIPKNAGTSLEKCLNTRETGHRRWEQYKDDYPLEWNTYTSFAVLRDPVERFISSYNYARMEKSLYHSSIPGDKAKYGMHPDYELCKSKSIDEVAEILVNNKNSLRHPGWWPQHYFVTSDGRIAVDCLINLTKLDAAIAELAPNAAIEHFNRSSSSQKTDLDEKSISMLSSFYSYDTDLYNISEKHNINILWTQASKSKNH